MSSYLTLVNGVPRQKTLPSGGGAKNYISSITTSNGVNALNGDFEVGSTTGWSLGNVSALTNGFPSNTSPTFGSGASDDLSLSVISSGQLAGSYSGSLVSSSATTAGNFLASDAFYIDTEDQAKVLTFQFYYSVPSGASNANFSGTTSNSFGVAIWDVTNSAWIQPAGCFGMTQSSGVGSVTGTFQTTSNSTQYRLVLYNANVTTGAITLYVDSFVVGPGSSQPGIIPEPINIVTYTSGSGTYTVPSNVYQLEIIMSGGGGGGGGSGSGGGNGAGGGTTTFGTSLLTALGGDGGQENGLIGEGGTATISSPAIGTVIQGGWGSPSFQDGTLYALGGSGGTNPLGGAGGGAGTTNVSSPTAGVANTGGGGGGGGVVGAASNFGGCGGGAGGYIEAIIPNTYSGQTFSYSVGTGGTGGTAGSYQAGAAGGSGIIIIREYSYGQNVQMSSDTDTRVVDFYGATSATTAFTGTTLVMSYTASLDTHGAFNGSNTYTIPISGDYKISAETPIYANGGTGNCSQLITVGGSTVKNTYVSLASGLANTLTTNYEGFIAAGTTIQIKVQNTSGVMDLLGSSAGAEASLTVTRRSGPSVIAATESVNATYTDTSGGSIGTSASTYTYTTKIKDTHNAYASGVYTIPISGQYRISASLTCNAVTLTGDSFIVFIYKNGVQIAAALTPGVGSDSYSATATVSYPFNTGDTVSIKPQCNTATTAITASGYNNFSLERVGN